jgi:hypothetical protein
MKIGIGIVPLCAAAAAHPQITVTSRLSAKEAQSRDGTIYIGTQAIAQAVGSAGFRG